MLGRKAVAAALLLVAAMSLPADRAAAVPLKWKVTHHGSHTAGSRYCPFSGCCCLPTLGPGPASAFELSDGYGNIDGGILKTALFPGQALHIVFGSAVTFTPDSVQLYVNDPIELDRATSEALGFSKITVQPGQYPYTTGSTPFGEFYLKVSLSESVPALSRRTMVIVTLLVLGLGVALLGRRKYAAL